MLRMHWQVLNSEAGRTFNILHASQTEISIFAQTVQASSRIKHFFYHYGKLSTISSKKQAGSFGKFPSNKKVILHENGSSVPPAPYHVHGMSCPRGGGAVGCPGPDPLGMGLGWEGWGYPVLILAVVPPPLPLVN